MGKYLSDDSNYPKVVGLKPRVVTIKFPDSDSRELIERLDRIDNMIREQKALTPELGSATAADIAQVFGELPEELREKPVESIPEEAPVPRKGKRKGR